MQDASYYRTRAAHMRRMADMVHQRDLRDTLLGAAQDYDDIVEDIEAGAIEIRHPELLPQGRR